MCDLVSWKICQNRKDVPTAPNSHIQPWGHRTCDKQKYQAIMLPLSSSVINSLRHCWCRWHSQNTKHGLHIENALERMRPFSHVSSITISSVEFTLTCIWEGFIGTTRSLVYWFKITLVGSSSPLPWKVAWACSRSSIAVRSRMARLWPAFTWSTLHSAPSTGGNRGT